MVLCLILDSQNETSSQCLISESPQHLAAALLKLNPENITNLSIQPILYFDSISHLISYTQNPDNDSEENLDPSFLPIHFKRSDDRLPTIVDPTTEGR